jgi:hypothetical protein
MCICPFSTPIRRVSQSSKSRSSSCSKEVVRKVRDVNLICWSRLVARGRLHRYDPPPPLIRFFLRHVPPLERLVESIRVFPRFASSGSGYGRYVNFDHPTQMARIRLFYPGRWRRLHGFPPPPRLAGARAPAPLVWRVRPPGGMCPGGD